MHLFADMALTMPDMTTSAAPCLLCALLGFLVKYIHQKGGLEWLVSILGILSSPVAPAAPAVPANPSPANPVGQGGTVAAIEADLVALKARVDAMKGQVNPVAPPVVAV